MRPLRAAKTMQYIVVLNFSLSPSSNLLAKSLLIWDEVQTHKYLYLAALVAENEDFGKCKEKLRVIDVILQAEKNKVADAMWTAASKQHAAGRARTC